MTLRNCYNKNRKPEPDARKLTESWARIYKAILEADECEMELSLQAHIEIFNDEVQAAAEEWSELIFTRALGMSQDELEPLYRKCVDFRTAREPLRNLKGAA